MASTTSVMDPLKTSLKPQTCTASKSSNPSKATKAFFKDASFLPTSNTPSICKSSSNKINETSSSSILQTCTKPRLIVSELQSNLFHAGFEDCASEVIRFLVEQENMDGHNPLIQGLQSHLRRMSSTICAENIADLDHPQLQTNQHTTTNIENTPATDLQLQLVNSSDLYSSTHSSQLQINSDSEQNNTGSEPTSLKRTLASDSPKDMSSFSADLEESSCSSSSKKNRLSCVDALQGPIPDIDARLMATPIISIDTDITGIQNDRIASFDHHRHHHHLLSPLSSSSLLSLLSHHQQQSSTSANCDSPQGPVPLSYNFLLPQPLGQSSPLPSIHSSFFTNRSSSPSTTTAEENSSNSQENKNLAAGTVLNSRMARSSPTTDNDPSSILELKAHFLPGIDTSSLASGNFADTLLAVESCQSHENPRVRELASKIIGLIHNTDDDDDDYEDEEDDVEEGDGGNAVTGGIVDNSETERVDGTGSAEHEDSGVDLGEDTADWCNPVDMIEL